jgi:hypothetical protein
LCVANVRRNIPNDKAPHVNRSLPIAGVEPSPRILIDMTLFGWFLCERSGAFHGESPPKSLDCTMDEMLNSYNRQLRLKELT